LSILLGLLSLPYRGRIKRTWGEDPFLIGQLATAHVLGLQGDHDVYTKMSSDLNMFAVHNGPDSIRTAFSANASHQDMMDTFLRGFHEPVKSMSRQKSLTQGT
jgi:beta-glucosidase-like glycosyl hydrolase